MLFDIQLNDHVPIIVHPERNSGLREQPDLLYDFVRNGSLTQITAGSMTGKFGSKVKKFTHELLENNLTHFIASDAHNVTSRPFSMLEGSKAVKDKYGEGMLLKLMENAQALIDDEMIYADEPHRIKRKKFFGLF